MMYPHGFRLERDTVFVPFARLTLDNDPVAIEGRGEISYRAGWEDDLLAESSLFGFKRKVEASGSFTVLRRVWALFDEMGRPRPKKCVDRVIAMIRYPGLKIQPGVTIPRDARGTIEFHPASDYMISARVVTGEEEIREEVVEGGDGQPIGKLILETIRFDVVSADQMSVQMIVPDEEAK